MDREPVDARGGEVPPDALAQPPELPGSTVSVAPPPPKKTMRTIALGLVAAATAMLGWHASGRYFGGEARQNAADRWDELRLCLLGDRLLPGVKPSERVRLIRLANPGAPKTDGWPTRCVDYAERLDGALEARAVRESVGPTPSAGYLVRRLEDAGARADLDLLHEILEAADLPLPRRSASVPTPPAPAKVQLAKLGLEPIGRVLRLTDIDAAYDPRNGKSLRLLVPEKKPLICRFDDGAARWTNAACRSSALTVPIKARLSLALTEEGAADLIRVEEAGDLNGFHDAATGLRVWPSRYFDAQAHVSANGVTTIVAAQLEGEEARAKVDHFRIIRSAPGERPEPRRLPLPSDARMLLLPQALLWWAPSAGAAAMAEVPLTAQAFDGGGNEPLGVPSVLGKLPAQSRTLGFCQDGPTTAVLFTAGIQDRRYALLFHGADGFSPLTDVGVIDGRVTLSCHEGAAMLTRIVDQRITRWRCTQAGCQVGSSSPLAMLGTKAWAVGPVGDKVAIAWAAPGGALRLRVGSPDGLAQMSDIVVMDDAEHGGIEVTELRLVTAGGTALLLVEDATLRVYPLRFDGAGTVTGVRLTR